MTRQRCQIYSRVVGFLTPISQWNKGKREEFRDRKTFDKQLRKATPAAITPEEGR
ncbi:anaerobic ribonucleoside-triphosphate reductase [Aminirod propionatiphilus]|uniref:Uncharacterized protein n=1 Tax=Aminirod propionatiphilus TaxID=3415223 RepID=A0ACD1DXU9_9BACT|nr:hypothetical protein KIH16_04405 [Synergistota bacterium]